MRHGPEGQQFGAVVRHSLDAEGVAGQRLPRDQRAQVVGEIREAGRAPGFEVQVPEVELPAVGLLATVLAYQAVQPAFNAALQAEIRRADGTHQSSSGQAGGEPYRPDKLC